MRNKLFASAACYAPDGSGGGAAKTVEQLLAETNAAFATMTGEVKTIAEEARTEARNSGTLTAQTKATADEALAKFNAISTALAALKASVDRQGGDVIDLARRVDKRNGGSPVNQTIGARFIASKEWEAFKAQGGRGGMRLHFPDVSFHNVISSVTPGGGGLSWSERDPTIIDLTRRRLTIRDLLPQGPTSASSIEFVRQVTRTNAAAVVSEGTTKPESNYAWEKDSTPVRTIAHIAKATRQIMDDVPRLQAIIDGEMRYGLALAEEDELLNGDGTGEHLDGLIPNATAYSAPIVIASEQQIDTLRLAILQVVLNDYAADGIVLHPSDWAAIELLKDGENRYLWSAPRSGMATPSMWGLPVVATTAMEVADFLVGSFAMGARIWDRMGVEVLISSEDGDNFKQNLLTVRAEERLALEVWRPLSLVFGEFAS